MSTLDTVRWGDDRLRVGPWRGDPTIAQITPNPAQPLAQTALDRCLGQLAGAGFRAVVTSALSPDEQAPFAGLGFVVHERLTLLRHDLAPGPTPRRPPAVPPPALRRGRRRDRARVLAVDQAAFSSFWRFDHRGLAEARAATPSSRFRVAWAGGLVGYAVTGRAGPVGYLQRLAVDPGAQRRGVGTALVLDALAWARRRGATSLLVNTQETNERALRLYAGLGFVVEPDGLAVLERSLPHRPAT